jgi:hypothetical protein
MLTEREQAMLPKNACELAGAAITEAEPALAGKPRKARIA